ncbi:hypothetical protein B484DRAFT_457403 [Ochromonadaceae sp. CCMP2298]|nr:hypothetical protein B484DRAFT_457403 [Ochromonadaceae sp. CCMP2298]
MNPIFEIKHVEGRGNGMFARRDIAVGELIVRERPFVWSGRFNSSSPHPSFCSTCGCYMQLQSSVGCAKACQLRYCSEECLNVAEEDGHRWVCACYAPGGVVDTLVAFDDPTHFILALHCYKRIAEHMTRHSLCPPPPPSPPSPLTPPLPLTGVAAAQEVMWGFQCGDFCHVTHALRTGSVELLSPALFDTLVAPAYYDSRLKDALSVIQGAFAQLPLATWSRTSSSSTSSTSSSSGGSGGSGCSGGVRASGETGAVGAEGAVASEAGEGDGADALARMEGVRVLFLSSGPEGTFSPLFFRHLVGTFLVNNHNVQLRGGGVGAGAGPGLPMTPLQPPQPPQPPQSHLQPQSQPHVELRGSGLYPTLSKMNHSCACNTTNSHTGHTVDLAVYATSPVLCGEELTTTYLHHLQVAETSLKLRRRSLLQYLFRCDCELCQAQSSAAAARGEESESETESEGAESDESGEEG